MKLLDLISKNSIKLSREWFRLMEWMIVIATLKTYSLFSKSNYPIIMLYISYGVLWAYIFFGLNETYLQWVKQKVFKTFLQELIFKLIIGSLVFAFINIFARQMLDVAREISEIISHLN